jgi:hypothetical protein
MLDFDGAPRPMKMGTTASPWHYGAETGLAQPVAEAAKAYDYATHHRQRVILPASRRGAAPHKPSRNGAT